MLLTILRYFGIPSPFSFPLQSQSSSSTTNNNDNNNNNNKKRKRISELENEVNELLRQVETKKNEIQQLKKRARLEENVDDIDEEEGSSNNNQEVVAEEGAEEDAESYVANINNDDDDDDDDVDDNNASNVSAERAANANDNDNNNENNEGSDGDDDDDDDDELPGIKPAYVHDNDNSFEEWLERIYESYADVRQKSDRVVTLVFMDKERLQKLRTTRNIEEYINPAIEINADEFEYKQYGGPPHRIEDFLPAPTISVATEFMLNRSMRHVRDDGALLCLPYALWSQYFERETEHKRKAYVKDIKKENVLNDLIDEMLYDIGPLKSHHDWNQRILSEVLERVRRAVHRPQPKSTWREYPY